MTFTSSQISEMTPKWWETKSIERRGGFIGDEQVRLRLQCHGDGYPLTHAPRKLIRIVVEAARGVRNAHLLQHFGRASALFGGAQLAVVHIVGHLSADRKHRVQRRHGILKDH
jgi:hypothetical protein